MVLFRTEIYFSSNKQLFQLEQTVVSAGINNCFSWIKQLLQLVNKHILLEQAFILDGTIVFVGTNCCLN